jgi:hypothetical protein
LQTGSPTTAPSWKKTVRGSGAKFKRIKAGMTNMMNSTRPYDLSTKFLNNRASIIYA